MPLYEYECDNGHRFEKIQKFSDPPIEICPQCGAKVRKLMSSPAIQFKGTGWYITDYAKKDSASAGKAEKTEKAEKTDSAAAKSDSKDSAKNGESKASDAKTDTKSESKATKTESSTTTKS